MSSESSSAAEILCSNLALGIHAAAQLRELTASSAVEVQRVCTLFGCLQQLVMVESTRPQLSPTPFLPLLAYAVDGVNLLFQQDGITLSSIAPDTCPPILANRARSLQALSRVLLIVHGLSRTRDTVELIVSTSDDAVGIVIRNLNLSVAVINAEASLSMALAETNVRSQQAALSVCLHPFTVRIELPQAPFAY